MFITVFSLTLQLKTKSNLCIQHLTNSNHFTIHKHWWLTPTSLQMPDFSQQHHTCNKITGNTAAPKLQGGWLPFRRTESHCVGRARDQKKKNETWNLTELTVGLSQTNIMHTTVAKIRGTQPPPLLLPRQVCFERRWLTWIIWKLYRKKSCLKVLKQSQDCNKQS